MTERTSTELVDLCKYVMFLGRYKEKQFFCWKGCLQPSCLIMWNLNLTNCVGYDKLLFLERYFKTSMKKFGYWILADLLRPVPIGSNEIFAGLY